MCRTHLFVYNREASCISIDHSREDCLSCRCGIANPTEVKGNADELLHLSVVLCPHLLKRWTELKLLMSGFK